jgi:DNA-directed RNA polymerase subunit alpha
MSILYGKFEMPEKIELEKKSSTSTFGRFIAEPFSKGFGHTVGNALRRMLLSSLEAPAIISIRLEGVSHEFMPVEGVVEDMIHIVLNLKGALLRKLPSSDNHRSRQPRLISTQLEITQHELDTNGGSVAVTLARAIQSGDFEVVNPDHYLFSVTKPMKKQLDFRVAISRGYQPVERLDVAERLNDEILVDGIFSPVRLVNYFVENTRVGKDTDFDRLILEISTDGRLTPSEALTLTAQIGIKHFEVFQSMENLELSFEEDKVEDFGDREDLMAKLALKISDIEFSVRASNCLSGAEIEYVAELVIKPESELLKFRNFGKKSLSEIKAKLTEMGLQLGMDLSPLGITRENIKEVIQSYNEQKEGAK